MRLAQLEDAARGYERIGFLVTQVVLFESLRSGGRSRYESRLTVELGR